MVGACPHAPEAGRQTPGYDLTATESGDRGGFCVGDVSCTQCLPSSCPIGSRCSPEKVYVAPMAFTVWLSADEERILERIMREEGTYSKQQAVIAAIREKGARLAGEHQVPAVATEIRHHLPARSVTEAL